DLSASGEVFRSAFVASSNRLCLNPRHPGAAKINRFLRGSFSAPERNDGTPSPTNRRPPRLARTECWSSYFPTRTSAINTHSRKNVRRWTCRRRVNRPPDRDIFLKCRSRSFQSALSRELVPTHRHRLRPFPVSHRKRIAIFGSSYIIVYAS